MSFYTPVRSVIKLDMLDDEEILKGYLAAYSDKHIEEVNVSESFWHGYRNGLVDSGKSKLDQAQKDLVRDVRKNGKIEEYHALLEMAKLFVENPHSVMN